MKTTPKPHAPILQLVIFRWFGTDDCLVCLRKKTVLLRNSPINSFCILPFCQRCAKKTLCRILFCQQAHDIPNLHCTSSMIAPRKTDNLNPLWSSCDAWSRTRGVRQTLVSCGRRSHTTSTHSEIVGTFFP